MAFKMKGSSYKMGGVKTKQTMAYMKSPLEQASPMKVAGGTFQLDNDMGTRKQISNQKAAKLKEAKEKARELQNKLNPEGGGGQKFEFANSEVKKMYESMGLSYDKDRMSSMEFTGLDNYTNPLSENYNPDIKNMSDLETLSEADITKVDDDGVVVPDNKHRHELAYEERYGASETEKQKKLDREALTDQN